jgi:3-dehydro-L-gulonate 2-dehydrogenase
MTETIVISASEMNETFFRILQQLGFPESKAAVCAEVFTANSIDGVYSHGVNRFPRFVEYVEKGYVKINAEPKLVHSAGALEQWDGQFGPGPLNAIHATDRATTLASQFGIGCVSLANNNHWMRAGYYGWRAAKAGYAFICWTNTIGNMPAWNATDRRLGNNPLVIAVPFNGEAIVLDMAMSLYSYGKMELTAMKKEQLPVDGGFDKDGKLTKDPQAIIESGRFMPIGYWKGAGLSLLLDILASVLSGGMPTHEFTKNEIEWASQVFIAFSLDKLNHFASIPKLLQSIIDDYHASASIAPDKRITYPGEHVLETRKKNLREGIPVVKKVWEEVKSIAQLQGTKR